MERGRGTIKQSTDRHGARRFMLNGEGLAFLNLEKIAGELQDVRRLLGKFSLPLYDLHEGGLELGPLLVAAAFGAPNDSHESLCHVEF